MRRKILIWLAIIIGLSLLIGGRFLYDKLDCLEHREDAQINLLWNAGEFSMNWNTMLDNMPNQQGNAEYFEAAAHSHEELRDSDAYLPVPACARSAKSALLHYMDAVIEVDYLLAQGADSPEVEAGINEADQLYVLFLEKVEAIDPSHPY